MEGDADRPRQPEAPTFQRLDRAEFGQPAPHLGIEIGIVEREEDARAHRQRDSPDLLQRRGDVAAVRQDRANLDLGRHLATIGPDPKPMKFASSGSTIAML